MESPLGLPPSLFSKHTEARVKTYHVPAGSDIHMHARGTSIMPGTHLVIAPPNGESVWVDLGLGDPSSLGETARSLAQAFTTMTWEKPHTSPYTVAIGDTQLIFESPVELQKAAFVMLQRSAESSRAGWVDAATIERLLQNLRPLVDPKAKIRTDLLLSAFRKLTVDEFHAVESLLQSMRR